MTVGGTFEVDTSLEVSKRNRSWIVIEVSGCCITDQIVGRVLNDDRIKHRQYTTLWMLRPFIDSNVFQNWSQRICGNSTTNDDDDLPIIEPACKKQRVKNSSLFESLALAPSYLFLILTFLLDNNKGELQNEYQSRWRIEDNTLIVLSLLKLSKKLYRHRIFIFSKLEVFVSVGNIYQLKNFDLRGIYIDSYCPKFANKHILMLCGMKNLKSLSLDGYCEADLSLLEQVEHLSLDTWCNMSYPKNLKSFEKRGSLDFSSHFFQHLTKLVIPGTTKNIQLNPQNFPALEILDIGGYGYTSLFKGGYPSSLKVLKLQSDECFKNIAHLTKLEVLKISLLDSDWHSIQTLPSITELDIRYVISLDNLSCFPNLKKLRFGIDTRDLNLSPLSCLHQLDDLQMQLITGLSITSYNVSNVNTLNHLKHLSQIKIFGFTYKCVTELVNCIKLHPFVKRIEVHSDFDDECLEELDEIKSSITNFELILTNKKVYWLFLVFLGD